MNEIKPELQEEGIASGILAYVIVILQHKEFIIKSTVAVTFISAVFSLFIPPVYLSQTKILPPQTANSSMSSVFASQMGGFGISPAALGVKTTNDLYVALVKTRSVSDFVANKHGLMKSYHINSIEGMRALLAANLTVWDDKKSGIVTIGFTHSDPRMAAEIANAYVEGLQNINNSLVVTEAAQRRLFFEEQLKNAKENLIRSEESMKGFQQRTGTIKIDDEAKSVMETVARMRAGISAKEVELSVLRSYATEENSDMQRLRAELAALKEELQKLESKNISSDDSVPTVGKMSALGTEYVRRMRDFRYNEALYEILVKQFGAARLDESKDAALVQVVERAEAPEKRIRPQRKKIVLNAFFLTLFVSVVLVLFSSFWQSFASAPGAKEKIQMAMMYLDFTQLRKDFQVDKMAEKTKIMVSKLYKK